MRKRGRIVRWDDVRGFGFLRAADTPADVFFHVRDWVGGTQRPAEGVEVVYEEIHVGGKGPRGMAVRPSAQREPAAAPSARSRPRAGAVDRRAPAATRKTADPHPGPMLLFVFAYAAVLAALVTVHRIPVPVALAIPLVSSLTFFAYWRDKHAARQGAWRTPEQTLHVFALLGGWPGAWLAQRVLRHKSRKESFRVAYWATVALHCGGMLVWALAAEY